MSKRGYKLVRFFDCDVWVRRRYFSAFHLSCYYTRCDIDRPRVFEYKIGVPTTRPDKFDPMAVFDTMENVEKFLKLFCPWHVKSNWRVFSCEYEPSAPAHIIENLVMPTGTRYADSVTLLEDMTDRVARDQFKYSG